MGLFDIFRRRSKKNKDEEKEKKEQETKSVQDQQQATKESKSVEQEVKQESSHQNEPESAAKSKNEDSKADETKDSSASFSKDSQNAEKTTPVAQTSTPDVSEAVEPEAKPTTEPSKSNVHDEDKKPEEPRDTGVTDKAQTIDEEPVSDVDGHSKVPEAPETAGMDSETASESGATQSYEKGLAKSRSSFGQKLNALLANFRHVDESFFDDLEDMLIESDVGFETSMKIADDLREEVKLQNAKKPKDVQNVIVKKLIDMYDQAGNGENPAINLAKSGPTVILMVGVNGVGKTTTIGKMAKMYKDQGKKVVLAAADTFRAGAIEQLNVWAQRDGVDIVKSKPKSDPSSVVFDAVKKARDEHYDILMVDTAGRLQNKVNLMNELSKMKKILTREIPEAPHEVLLVLDATTGQNAMTQAKMFKEATDVTGIVLTKLDGTARGGIVLAIRSELHLPVKYVGLGEKVTDLKPFDPNDFVYGLFKGLISE
ncbi:signal recognition particle-docking protein FtsY [Lentilactobacillus hilgardii]|uniref:signal recognition particle-docking protein FtsY n=1 Tax=Lentilactobacillus hilgardii TaxID=1588 RepID=UPI0021A5CFB2|nr:signal recognition particle-docking protein FtsY [Lentilactobacillus hilgardii]MCT3398282.1 signal recognition particle-docking protein FtsY [Lentilactobacillus hilgardii]